MRINNYLSIQVVFMAVILSLGSSMSFSHSGGHKNISSTEAMNIAYKATIKMIGNNIGQEFGLLPKSWKEASLDDAELVKIVKDFYIISIINKKNNSKIYYLIAKNGQVYDVNFTGKFEGIN